MTAEQDIDPSTIAPIPRGTVLATFLEHRVPPDEA